uniref:Uncharacterized protein n=1 Tax=Magallana gigas TaxID=29159 RepID=K1RE46_MAGGI
MDKVKEEAERYSEYVREKLGDILSSAVADVAAARPEDPIDFLAHRLYTTRVSCFVTETTHGHVFNRNSHVFNRTRTGPHETYFRNYYPQAATESWQPGYKVKVNAI